METAVGRRGLRSVQARAFRRTFRQIATPGIAEKARDAAIYKTTRFSDHAPLTIAYDLPIG